jgi:hypothetical protein
MNAQVRLRPNLQNLHIIVHDALTGNTGSIVIPTAKLSAHVLHKKTGKG